MSSVSSSAPLNNLDKYISWAGSLAQKVEQDSKTATSKGVINDPSKFATAQLQLEKSQLEFKNAVTIIKKMLDLMKEILQMFSSR